MSFCFYMHQHVRFLLKIDMKINLNYNLLANTALFMTSRLGILRVLSLLKYPPKCVTYGVYRRVQWETTVLLYISI